METLCCLFLLLAQGMTRWISSRILWWKPQPPQAPQQPQAPQLRVTPIQALQRANLPLVLLASFLPFQPCLGVWYPCLARYRAPFTAQMTRQAPRLRVTPIQAPQRANLPLVLLASFLPFQPCLGVWYPCLARYRAPFTAQMTRQAPRLRVTPIQAPQRANLPLVLLASFLPFQPCLGVWYPCLARYRAPFTAQMTRQAPRLRVTPIQAPQRANLPLVLLASFLPFQPCLGVWYPCLAIHSTDDTTSTTTSGDTNTSTTKSELASSATRHVFAFSPFLGVWYPCLAR